MPNIYHINIQHISMSHLYRAYGYTSNWCVLLHQMPFNPLIIIIIIIIIESACVLLKQELLIRRHFHFASGCQYPNSEKRRPTLFYSHLAASTASTLMDSNSHIIAWSLSLSLSLLLLPLPITNCYHLLFLLSADTHTDACDCGVLLLLLLLQGLWRRRSTRNRQQRGERMGLRRQSPRLPSCPLCRRRQQKLPRHLSRWQGLTFFIHIPIPSLSLSLSLFHSIFFLNHVFFSGIINCCLIYIYIFWGVMVMILVQLFTWGWNQRGTLGHPPETKTENIPSQVKALANVKIVQVLC